MARPPPLLSPDSNFSATRFINLHRYRFLAVVAALAFLVTIYHQLNSSQNTIFALSSNPVRQKDQFFPRKIWQKWEIPAQALDGELQRFARSWIDKNPTYRYELFTSQSAVTYVAEKFEHRPDIVRVFANITEPILRADLIRYLALLGDGGTYTDIDTHCTRPVDTWIPPVYRSMAGLVVGIEYDAQGEEISPDFATPVQFCQWTFMAKPGNPTLQYIVDRVVKRLEEDYDPSDVLEVTGPRIFTRSLLESLSSRIGYPVTYGSITNLTQPQLIGDILILPISAFGSGQKHSGSKHWGNEEQLMSHHWFGFRGWKSTTEQNDKA